MSSIVTRTLGAICIGAVLVLGGFAGAVAQEAPAPAPGEPIRVGSTTDENPQPWTINCTSQGVNADLVCTMSQVLISSDTQQRLIAASVFRPQPSAAAILRLSLPHGILLPQGVDVWIDDGAPTKQVISIADQNGSYSDIELGSNMLVSLQGGSFLRAGVVAANGEKIEFTLSLKGFTAAFAKL